MPFNRAFFIRNTVGRLIELSLLVIQWTVW